MPEPEELRARLVTLAPSLGKAQRQAARAILEDLEAIAYLPAADLAERAGVHTATVVRLAQRLGFEGYPHLQRSLRSTLSKYPHFLRELASDSETDNGPAMFDAVLAQARRNLEHLARTASPAHLADAAETLAHARRVLVLGLGVAGPVAAHLVSSLRLLGVAADQPVDPVSTVQQLGQLATEDAMVAIDFHRYYRATVDAAAAAASAGARVIALTDSEVSPLAASARLTLIAPSESPTPRTSLAPALTLVEALIAMTARADRARAEEAMRRVDASYAALRVFVGE